MSFEDFVSTCSRTFAQTPIRLIRLSSSLTPFPGCLDPPYKHLVLLCQPHFTETSISVAFYLSGTAYFEHLNEEKIRQRLQLLNNPRKRSYRPDLGPVFERLKSLLSIDSIKQDTPENELHAKLLSARLLSIELSCAHLKFKFRCEERPELFEQHYVRQLLVQVKEMSQRQTYLCQLLEHKDELPQFDAKLFLNTPMTLVDDQEEEDEDAEILSTSTTARLWKAAFGRRSGQKFLDICLLKKAYVKALDNMVEEDQNEDTVSSIVSTNAEQHGIAEAGDDDEDGDDDEKDLRARVGKRSKTSNLHTENDSNEMKRSRSSPTSNVA